MAGFGATYRAPIAPPAIDGLDNESTRLCHSDEGAIIYNNSLGGLGHLELSSPSGEEEADILSDILRPVLGRKAGATGRSLLHRFGDIAGIARAARNSYLSRKGPAERALETLGLAQEFANRAAVAQLRGHRIEPQKPIFLEHVAKRLTGRLHEFVIAYFCDAKHRLIAEEVLAFGEEGSVCLPSRSLFHRALDLNCRCLVLAHNHPSGRADPSPEDVRATLRLHHHAVALQIDLLDHLIVGQGAVFSMKRAGLI